MKIILIFASCVALSAADVSTLGGYSSSLSTPAGSYLPPKSNQKEVVISADNYVPKVYKHVYVHSAPDDEIQKEKRVIRVNGGDKHVNIIFVKAPSESSLSQTEVVLPEPDQQKNIVYVLVQKSAANNDIKVTRPQPKAPTKPEVHFIRYENENAADAQAEQPPATPSGLYGTPAVAAAPVPPPPSKPSGLYGTPSAEAISSPQRTQPIRPPTRVYGTPADVPPLTPVRQPSGLYETPSL